RSPPVLFAAISARSHARIPPRARHTLAHRRLHAAAPQGPPLPLRHHPVPRPPPPRPPPYAAAVSFSSPLVAASPGSNQVGAEPHPSGHHGPDLLRWCGGAGCAHCSSDGAAAQPSTAERCKKMWSRRIPALLHRDAQLSPRANSRSSPSRPPPPREWRDTGAPREWRETGGVASQPSSTSAPRRRTPGRRPLHTISSPIGVKGARELLATLFLALSSAAARFSESSSANRSPPTSSLYSKRARESQEGGSPS
ncbi:unnamed protein product, partial [Urochloa humidicola]